jgi:phosphoribosylformylglycinamidine synthase I
MKLAILRFPGSNCDDDAFHVSAKILGGATRFVWHKDTELGDTDAVIIPGGFSYGDYLRAGAMAAQSPIMPAVKRFADQGGPVLAICNGFQIACEAGLLPGVLTRNASLHFECRDVHLVVEGKPTPWTRHIPAGRILKMPVAHAEGRYVHADVDKLQAEGRVIFRYVDAAGGHHDSANPNGSAQHIAGVCNAAGNVVGLMPHPERASEEVLGSADGFQLFASVRAFVKGGGKAGVRV